MNIKGKKLMENKKYAFAGNRAFVLQRMRELKLNICKIWAVKDSYLAKYLDDEGLDYEVIEEKEQFEQEIGRTDFDVFVSNGLPIILSKEVFGNNSKVFVNIHPSLLPDLRGKNPITGVILYKRDAGVTCHIMDKGIDSGDIISQVKIPYSDDLDAALLYQLAFRAEADAFEAAYERNFLPVCKQILRDTDIYYSNKAADAEIDLNKDTAERILSKVRAFSTGNKGAKLHIGDKTYICSNIKCINNSYAKEYYSEAAPEVVLLQYENRIIVKNAFNELLDITVKSIE